MDRPGTAGRRICNKYVTMAIKYYALFAVCLHTEERSMSDRAKIRSTGAPFSALEKEPRWLPGHHHY
jgi:hypothetical protein